MGSYLLESASLLGMIMLMGAPVVTPSKTPDKISARSASVLGEVYWLLPGARRAKAALISLSSILRPAGQPSITTPMALPWDSPQVVILKIWPNVLLPILILLYIGA